MVQAEVGVESLGGEAQRRLFVLLFDGKRKRHVKQRLDILRVACAAVVGGYAQVVLNGRACDIEYDAIG